MRYSRRRDTDGHDAQLPLVITAAHRPGRLLALHTVKTHVGHVMAKLGLRDRIQIVVYAYETGLITPQGRAWAPSARDPSSQ
jgi:hypothetical protein